MRPVKGSQSLHPMSLCPHLPLAPGLPDRRDPPADGGPQHQLLLARAAEHRDLVPASSHHAAPSHPLRLYQQSLDCIRRVDRAHGLPSLGSRQRNQAPPVGGCPGICTWGVEFLSPFRLSFGWVWLIVDGVGCHCQGSKPPPLTRLW